MKGNDRPLARGSLPPLLALRAREALASEWPTTEQEAIAVQQLLRERVVREDSLPHDVRHVAGVDVAYAKDESKVFAGVAVIDAATLRVVETQTAIRAVEFPYVPGLFAFRELPAVLACLSKVSIDIDLLICDAQGIAHPRRAGLASHLGVILDAASIGAAKTRLVGMHGDPDARRGSSAALVDGGEVIGAVLRTRDDVKPIVVSIGHRVSLSTAIAWTLRLCPRFRLPEPTRQADQLVNALRRESRDG